MGDDIDTLIEEVRRLDREGTPGPWLFDPMKCWLPGFNGATPITGAQEGVFHDNGSGTVCVTGPAEDRQSMSDSALIATFRTAAPALAAEIQRLNAEVADAHRREAEALRRADAAIASLAAALGEVRDLRNALTFADQQGAEAIERVSTAIVNDKWNATSAFQARALNAEKERDALRLALAAERAGSGPWFVVHQRDGRPQLDVFSGDGAEHAAKMRARDHATNWSEVYIMRGVEVHGGDFEDEAMADRALSVKDPIRAESVQIDPETYAQVHRWAEPDIGGRSLNESTEALLSDLERVQAELEEARLTLAAEQGDSEGAPSDRWRCDGRNWYGDRGDGGMDKIEWYATLNGDGTVRHKRVWLDIDMHGFEKERGRFDLSRVAMQAADKALKAGSSS